MSNKEIKRPKDFFVLNRKLDKTILWTDSQIKYVIDQYEKELKTLDDLGAEFNCTSITIYNLLKKHKAKIRQPSNKSQKNFNWNYFSSIDSEEKAYWLGYLSANQDLFNEIDTITFITTDKNHAFSFKEAIDFTHYKVQYEEDKCIIVIKNKIFVKNIKKWISFPLKRIPNIPRDYVSHFIRGYYDNVGRLHFSKDGLTASISIIAKDPAFLEDVRSELRFEQVSLGYGKNTDTYQLQISGYKKIKNVLSYLYRNSNPKIVLTRRYLLCIEFLKRAPRH